MTRRKIVNFTYTDDYRNKCFQIFYMLGRPVGAALLRAIPDEGGRKPTAILLNQWRDELGWDWRADELDARVQAKSDDHLVEAKVLMFKEQAARGRELQNKGMEHIREFGFDSAASAVSAVVRGAELEQTARGVSDAIRKLASMSDLALTKKIEELVKKLPDGAGIIIDGQELEEKKTEEETDEAI